MNKIKLKDKTKEILNRCDTLKLQSQELKNEIRRKSLPNISNNRVRQQNQDLHQYLENQILNQSTDTNQAANIYKRKHSISSYLKNPALYNKMLSGVTRRRLSYQSIILKQFNAQQEKYMYKAVDASAYVGFK